MNLAIKVSLVVLEGEERGRTFALIQGHTILGRSRGDLLLVDKKISSEHLSFIIEGKKLFVEDLASTNGTFVNDERIDNRTELRNLDQISIGFSKIQVSIVEDLQQFRQANTPAPQPHGKIRPESSARPSKKVKGERANLDQLIDEELKRFSRWDLNQERNSMPSFKKSLTLPEVKLSLQIMEGPEKGRLIQLAKGNSVLGRGKTDVTIKDNDISRNHASIESFTANQIFIRDMASTNGTFVNKKRISYSKLSHGDIIQMGSTIMRFVVGEEEKA